MPTSVDEAASNQVNNLIRDVMWPFREYSQVSEFASRVPSASLSLFLIGETLGKLNFSPGITGAVSAIGIATILSEVMLRILLSKENPLDAMNIRRRGLSTLIFMLSGFGFFLLMTPGASGNLQVSALQFSAGVGISFLAGAAHMRTFTALQETVKLRWAIIGSMFVSMSVALVSVLVVLEALKAFGNELANVLQKTPSEASLKPFEAVKDEV